MISEHCLGCMKIVLCDPYDRLLFSPLCERCGGFDRVVDPVADRRARNLALIIGAIGLLLILCLGGCASVPRDIAIEEGVFQAEHLVDTLQTADIRHTRLSEVQCDEFMGHKPSSASVWQYMSGEALAHAGITALLLPRHPQAARFWEAFTIGFQGAVDLHNARLGLSVKL